MPIGPIDWTPLSSISLFNHPPGPLAVSPGSGRPYIGQESTNKSLTPVQRPQLIGLKSEDLFLPKWAQIYLGRSVLFVISVIMRIFVSLETCDGQKDEKHQTKTGYTMVFGTNTTAVLFVPSPSGQRVWSTSFTWRWGPSASGTTPPSLRWKTLQFNVWGNRYTVYIYLFINYRHISAARGLWT